MKLAPNFTFEEFIRSDTASREGIDNTPNTKELIQLVYLAKVMQEVRALFNRPVHVTSGFRCVELNRAIGSFDASKHVQGRACDFCVSGFHIRDAFGILKASNIGYSKLILEFPDSGTGWIHLEINEFGALSQPKFVLAEKVNGKTVYSNIS
jgi:zinc D-Ala-D-Ala carboxypeptidase